ncbi:ectonucleoside triphosphate diphosphohydrolase 1-like [Paramacrobiotus metropolitanus]|uniref:ectonucleoside triphosphate diphosphohydrolase 1-like n=1 Tax=Paramacrobiotus metropolitanus TaxID=2943436 RepID=UPI0024461236|nr:ectonucleoside triphosphate diphosphohydrolase 1-like [Paramacrobiotus metropolitanus]
MASIHSEKMLRVQIESLVAGIDGAETIMTSESATVGNLIAGFIIERRLRTDIVSEFCVQDPKGNVLKNHRTVGSYAIRDGDKLFLAKRETRILLGCKNWFALAAVACCASLIGFAVMIYLYARSGAVPVDFVVVIDAGSTHTDLYVYQWDGMKIRGTGLVKQNAHTRCENHGLENYVDPRMAARSLETCMGFAKDSIPRPSWDKTEIYLGATAGMRLLEATNATMAASIMDAIRTEVNGNYPFKYSAEHVRIISGIEEGIYGWITVNYLAKTLLFDHIAPKSSVGALDLGGASAQITFDSEVNYTQTATLFQETYDLYSHSFLCYGLREAERQFKALLVQEQNQSVILNPCAPTGNTTVEPMNSVFGHYCTSGFHSDVKSDSLSFVGTSNSTECSAMVGKLFNKTYCPYSGFDRCSFNGVYEAPLTGKFMAFSGFYFVMEFFNLTNVNRSGGVVPLPLYREVIKDFCLKNYSEINILNASDPHSPFITQYCFDAHFVDNILTLGYGFNDTTFEQIRFVPDIDGMALGWTLGLALNSTNARDNEPPENLVSTAVFISLMVVFTVLLIFAMVFCLRAVKAARRYRDYESISSTYGAI